jgi:hypothetical protein
MAIRLHKENLALFQEAIRFTAAETGFTLSATTIDRLHRRNDRDSRSHPRRDLRVNPRYRRRAAPVRPFKKG